MKYTALILATIVVTMTGSLAEGSFKYVQQGMDAPQAEIVTLDGNSVRVDELYGPNGTIILFWALWSPRSLQQLIDLAGVYDSLQTAGVAVVAVSVDKQKFDGPLIAEIRRYTEEQQIPFSTYVDQGLRFFYTYGIIATPSSAVIDTAHRVLYELSGYSMFGADTMVQTALAVLGLSEDIPDTMPTIRFPDRRAGRYFGLGRKMMQRNPAAALSYFQQAAQIDTMYAAAYYYISLCAETVGDLSAALTAAEEAAQREDQNAMYLVRWARMAARQGDTAHARQLAHKAREIDTTCLESDALLAAFALMDDDVQSAAEYIDHGMTIDSANLHLNFLEGQRLIQTGDTAAALELYRSALNRILDYR